MMLLKFRLPYHVGVARVSLHGIESAPHVSDTHHAENGTGYRLHVRIIALVDDGLPPTHFSILEPTDYPGVSWIPAVSQGIIYRKT